MCVTFASLAWHCIISSQMRPDDHNESETAHGRNHLLKPAVRPVCLLRRRSYQCYPARDPGKLTNLSCKPSTN